MLSTKHQKLEPLYSVTAELHEWVKLSDNNLTQALLLGCLSCY
jgi:hypothetical protein